MSVSRLKATIAIATGACLAALAPWASSSSPNPAKLPPILSDTFAVPEVRLDFDSISQPASAQAPDIRPAAKPVVIPIEIPGADAVPLALPPRDPASPKAFDEAFDRLFPPLPPVGTAMPPDLSPDGRPYSLEALEQMAKSFSPVIRQAHASVDAAQGTVRQTGLYPNPILGFQQNGIEQNRTSGAVGGFFNVEVVYLAKLRLAKAVAVADRELAQIAVAQIESEVIAGVRHGYFAVLAAQENMRVQEALARLADDAYRRQAEQARAGQSAAHEAVQVRAVAFQSRGQLLTARNRYLSAWKQLAATIGRIELPPTMLDGRIDRPLPIIDFETLHATVLSRHTDVLAAQKLYQKSALAVQLAETNRIPDVSVAAVVQRDSTFGLDNGIAAVRVGVPVPIFNRNQGAIARARADMVRAQEEAARVRADLTQRMSEAFERYDTQRRLVVYARDAIVPDQVRAFRALVDRRAPFAEQLAAQQALISSISSYQHTLGEAWAAVVDLGRLAQSNDLASLGSSSCGTQLSCLNQLPSCQGNPTGLYWPDVMPSADDNPRQLPATRGDCLPDPQLRGGILEPNGVTPRIPSNPVSSSVLVAPLGAAPLGSVERSTKRLKIFSWPTRRGETAWPIDLPQSGDAAPCCPTLPGMGTPPPMLDGMPEPKAIPKSLPNAISNAPSQLPPSLPPIATPVIVDRELPPPPAPPQSMTSPPPNRIPLPIIIEGPSPLPAPPPSIRPAAASRSPQEAAQMTLPEPPPAPVADIPSLRLPKLR